MYGCEGVSVVVYFPVGCMDMSGELSTAVEEGKSVGVGELCIWVDNPVSILCVVIPTEVS